MQACARHDDMLHAAYKINNMCRFLKSFVWVQPTHDPSFTDAFAKSPEGGASGMLMPHPMTLILLEQYHFHVPCVGA